MSRRNRRDRRDGATVANKLYDVIVRPPGADHALDDDCAICRMMAGKEPIEVVTMADGSVYEVHEMPAPGPRGGSS